MRKQEVIELLQEKMDEVFAELQQREGINHGDIDMDDAFALDALTEQTASLILKAIDSQKRSA